MTPDNIHDSLAFDDVYDAVTEKFPQVKTVVADSAYKTPIFVRKYLTMAEYYLQPTSAP